MIYKPIDIGSECWIAAGSFVCPGVKIATGAVIGAKSVVTKSILEPWTVHGGNPAEKIRNRQIKNQPE
ncbi:putative acetyltransferase [Sphaerotilus natans subsp. natans DSM 6575]|uniref:Putative acetyltransferase n=1 Tax=Sphaerotilus natans subsp. natans DSM 6575 TaxID=1286631 RepID=A0A059KJ63_9BURK|nr:putative acetyltransferase [Sphaerotilus natans subsp. natans DSM 6575]